MRSLNTLSQLHSDNPNYRVFDTSEGLPNEHSEYIGYYLDSANAFFTLSLSLLLRYGSSGYLALNSLVQEQIINE